MRSVEIDFVVKNSLEAIEKYNKVFEINIIKKTNLDQRLNEVIFEIFGSRFHILDENLEYQIVAPKENENMPVWFNITVENIEEIVKNGEIENFTVISPIKEIFKNIKNAVLKDPYGYVWIIHQNYN